MTKVGMRILLGGGNFIGYMANDREAGDLIRKWREGRLDTFLSGYDYAPDGQRWEWCVKTSDIVGMHTIVVPPERTGGVLGVNRSGLN